MWRRDGVMGVHRGESPNVATRLGLRTQMLQHEILGFVDRLGSETKNFQSSIWKCALYDATNPVLIK